MAKSARLVRANGTAGCCDGIPRPLTDKAPAAQSLHGCKALDCPGQCFFWTQPDLEEFVSYADGTARIQNIDVYRADFDSPGNVSMRTTAPYYFSVLEKFLADSSAPRMKSDEVDNRRPRLDTDGGIVDAHGGQLAYYCDNPALSAPCTGKFWLIGTAYNTGGAHPGTDAPTAAGCVPNRTQQCDSTYHHCGYRDHDFRAYSSTSIGGPWKLEADTMMQPRGVRPSCVYWRPKILYSKRDSRWVLWYECADPLPAANCSASRSCNKRLTVFGVAVTASSSSASPAGPYYVLNPNASAVGLRYGNGVGDSSLFQDADGTAYIIYTPVSQKARAASHGMFHMTVERLTANYTASTGHSAGFQMPTLWPYQMSEAPALFFDHNAREYVASVSHLCCFCASGGALQLFRTSVSPLQGWRRAELINTIAGGTRSPPSNNNCGLDNSTSTCRVSAQQTYVATLPTSTNASGPNPDQRLVFVGDRWGSAWDGTKGHDFQHWEPLVSRGSFFAPLRNLSSWTLHVTKPLETGDTG